MRGPLAAAAVVAALSATGCGGPPAAPRPALSSPPARPGSPPARPGSQPARPALTRRQACDRLLADVRRTGGAPGQRALREVADHARDPRMAADARTAVKDLEHTGIAPIAFALLRDDCARAGVRLPRF